MSATATDREALAERRRLSAARGIVPIASKAELVQVVRQVAVSGGAALSDVTERLAVTDSSLWPDPAGDHR